MVLYKRYVLFILYEKYDFNFIGHIPQSGMCPIKVQTRINCPKGDLFTISILKTIRRKASLLIVLDISNGVHIFHRLI